MNEEIKEFIENNLKIEISAKEVGTRYANGAENNRSVCVTVKLVLKEPSMAFCPSEPIEIDSSCVYIDL